MVPAATVHHEWWALGALSRYPLGDNLAQVNVPVSFIIPGDGLAERTHDAAALVDSAHVVERPEWGYGIFDTEAEEIASMINTFLDTASIEADIR